MSEVRGAIQLCTKAKMPLREKAMLKSILDLTDIEVYDVMNHRKTSFLLMSTFP
ncbi:MAG: hypothetical protein ACLU99_08730 [Alphaproteobacteria bacterium]